MSRLSNARSELERFEQTKPADYQSKYQGQIDNVMGKLDDLGGYDYDPAADTAYQQYKSEYTQKAKLANQNAQASASALTGGYGSSYGTQAGQKAYAATMSDLDTMLDSLTSQSRSEYIEKAILFYTGFLYAEKADRYLPKVLQQILAGTLERFAERIGRQLFKLAVEQNVNNHILASDTDIDARSYQKMRGLSMDEVKRTNGRIDFEDALLSERGV